MTDRDRFKACFSRLHASADTLTEVLNMHKQEKHFGKRLARRGAVAALAAVLALALGITALAFAGAFSVKLRQAGEGERFRLNFVEDQELYWKDAKLVFNFDGPETARKIRFRPGYLPAPATYSQTDSAGWYTRLTTENGGGQPCQIEVYYAPMFMDGGNLILLYDEPKEIAEETWGDYQVIKFASERQITRSDTQETRTFDGSYVLLCNQAEGYLIVVSGQSELAELERVARELEVETTEELIRAAGYQGENRFIDWGVG